MENLVILPLTTLLWTMPPSFTKISNSWGIQLGHRKFWKVILTFKWVWETKMALAKANYHFKRRLLLTHLNHKIRFTWELKIHLPWTRLTQVLQDMDNQYKIPILQALPIRFCQRKMEIWLLRVAHLFFSVKKELRR